MRFEQLCVTESYLDFVEDPFVSCEDESSQEAREDEGRPVRKVLFPSRQELMVAGNGEVAMGIKTWSISGVTDYHSHSFGTYGILL